MLSKCANPSCSNQLIYLREGKIFVMEHGPRPKLWQQDPAPAGHSTYLEHFWLCGRCAETLTLVYDRERGVKVMPKPVKPPQAAAS